MFLGPSGCGKTTTMRMIAGLTDLTSGEVWLDDELVNEVDARDRDVAMVFQSYALYPNMTIYQNIRLRAEARAGCHPRVFLMDEPLSNLDAKLRSSMRVQLKHVQRQLKITTIYVTHDQIEAMTLADRIVIMEKGRIQQTARRKKSTTTRKTCSWQGLSDLRP